MSHTTAVKALYVYFIFHLQLLYLNPSSAYFADMNSMQICKFFNIIQSDLALCLYALLFEWRGEGQTDSLPGVCNIR